MTGLFNADCMEALYDIPSKSIDLVVTDPPYLIETVGAGIYKDPTFGASLIAKELTNAGLKDGFNSRVLDQLCRVMKQINCYIWCSQKQILPLLSYFVRGRGCNWNIICWHKTNPIPATGNKYLTDTEFCLFFREKGVRVHGSYDTKHTYYVTFKNTPDKHKYGHPTIKPLNIIKNLIINSSQPGDIVLDPFAGSGTTAVAAIELGRKYLCYEINPEYYETASRRIEDARKEVEERGTERKTAETDGAESTGGESGKTTVA